MTAKPATLSLDSSEWRTVLANNIGGIAEFVQTNTDISLEQMQAMQAHFDRMKLIVSAWHRSAPQVAQDAPKEKPQPIAPVATQANGAAPKKRGGWPLGKPRKKRNAPGIAQNVQ